MADAAVVRTPDERFAELRAFPFRPVYRQWQGLRVAHVDEGDPDAPVVLMQHGEPTWSFLWRKVLPPVRDAGFRVILPDLPGFGRSDKPTDVGWYSYDRHAAALGALVVDLDLRGVTMVVHDWGGPIGLRVAVEHADRVDRLVLMDTGVFTGRQRMSAPWIAFRDFVQRTPDLPIGMLVRRACLEDPGDEVAAAYDAPFPDAASKAGARAFPLILPTAPDAAGAEAGRRVLDALGADDRPALVLWAEHDPILPVETGAALAQVLGYPPPSVIPGASHFLQEDQGELVGRRIVEWLARA